MQFLVATDVWDWEVAYVDGQTSTFADWYEVENSGNLGNFGGDFSEVLSWFADCSKKSKN